MSGNATDRKLALCCQLFIITAITKAFNSWFWSQTDSCCGVAGLYPRESFDTSLCDDDKFADMSSWITQASKFLFSVHFFLNTST